MGIRKFESLLQARDWAAENRLREKAVCFVLRGPELLVFDHVPDDSGVQLPAGGVEAGETDQQALKRELLHRLGVEIDVGKLISFVSHPYENYVVDLFLYECTLVTEMFEVRAVNAYKWVPSGDFDQYPFTPADEASMNKLLGVF